MSTELFGFLHHDFEISEKVIKLAREVDRELEDFFAEIREIQEYNSYKITAAMQKMRLSDTHFGWNTGYGYNDAGREKVEEIFAEIFRAEDAIVRPTIANGTHALALCLEGILKNGYELISISGKPYDTLDQTIGIVPSYQSLQSRGVVYTQVELLPSGDFDFEAITNALVKSEKQKMIYIQRSKGYFRRRALTIHDIEQAVSFVKNIDPEAIVMIDNCYGEFMETKEPIEVGADIMAGSLIKNPGGGLAISGGYIVGKADLIEKVAARMTAPGIGKECGLTFGTTRILLQGLFIAPMIVANAKKRSDFLRKTF